MLKRLYDILSLFKEYVLLSLLLAVSVVLLALNDTPQIRALRSIAVGGIALIQDLTSVIPNYFSLRGENRVLREQNLTLSDEVNRLREARLENIRLRQLLGLKERAEYEYVSASVIGKTLQLMRNTMTLDVGEKDGVHVNMPIVTASGLVGRVSFAGPYYAVGQILLHRDMRVSAKVQRSRVDGIILWRGGDRVELQNVAKTLDVQVGDVVITSEYSSLYPPGIRIGTVAETNDIPGSLFRFVSVTPAVDFTTVEEVFVITHLPDSARTAVESAQGK